MNQHTPITDSPWFWVLVFSLMSFGALAAIGGRYGHRQAGIEREFQARDRIAAGDAAQGDQPAPRPYATPGATLVPLWPLALVLGLAACGAAAMLLCERRKGRDRGRPRPLGEGRPGSPGDGSVPP